MKRKIYIPVILVLVAGAIFSYLFYRHQTRCALYPVRFGCSENLNFLPALASHSGAFEENCLQVKLSPYDTGKQALRGLIDDDVDICVVGLGPFAYEAIKNDSLRIVASIATFYDLYTLIARKDHGLLEPTDLKRHKIGTTSGSSIHYFLDHYLLEYRIPEDSVEIIFQPASELVESFVDGDLDAICLRDPYIGQAEKELNGKVIRFESVDLPANTLNVVTTERYIKLHPEVVENFVQALVDAEDDYLTKSSDFGEFIQSLNMEKANAWTDPNTRLHVSLEQNLILELENVTRWLIRHDMLKTQVVPDYREFIDTTFLSHSNPAAVTIIR